MIRHYYHLLDDESQRQMRRMNFLESTIGAGADGEGDVSAEDINTQSRRVGSR